MLPYAEHIKGLGNSGRRGEQKENQSIMHDSGPISCHGEGETEAGRACEKERMLSLQTRGQQCQPAKGTKEKAQGKEGPGMPRLIPTFRGLAAVGRLGWLGVRRVRAEQEILETSGLCVQCLGEPRGSAQSGAFPPRSALGPVVFRP